MGPTHMELSVDMADASERGRRRSRSGEADLGDQDCPRSESAYGHNGDSINSDEIVRKRRRSRKGLDKRFECTTEGCGKSYSRAEHLYRHQLNHNSKQLFRCEYPDCTRTFVRGDLLKRHMDRHTAKGSQLSRRDSVINHVSQVGAPGLASPESKRVVPGYSTTLSPSSQYRSSHETYGGPYSPTGNAPSAPYSNDAYSHHNGVQHHSNNGFSHEMDYSHHVRVQSPVRTSYQPLRSTVGSYGSDSNQQLHESQPRKTTQTPAFVSHQSALPYNHPNSQFSNGHGASHSDLGHQSSESLMLENMTMQATVPMFGTDSVPTKFPYVGMPEDFLTFLFDNSSPSGERSPESKIKHAAYSYYNDTIDYKYSDLYVGNEISSMGYFPAAPQQVMAVNNLLDQNDPEASISEDKSQEIFDLIKERFHQHDHAPVECHRDSILEGDRAEGNHILSKQMMQAYIVSYWYHFSDQMPILHKPTFSPNKTPNLLLLAIMSIGAALLDRTHGPKVVKAGAKLSNFLAWQLRWEIFMDTNSRPPAKLWVFQTLILLELYEKMYSTRELHERANIHHASMIQLMRRGRSLLGKPIMETLPHPLNGSRSSSTAPLTAEEWWDQWVTNESTRRAAFAAFIIDSTHATMFGHSGVMVAHEMRLPLPCDEALWRATSSAEVGRIETNLLAEGIKPISFIEGLKRTLSRQGVQTNSLGRTVLMAGLLSVSWHMNQRDLQVNVFGGRAISSLGGRDNWRATLTRAYDSWKADFDGYLQGNEPSTDPYRFDAAQKNEFNLVFESRTVLHALSHMAMHAEILDIQMFARAKKLLGRAIGPQELYSAQRRIKNDWAPSARARDATFYALKFLCSVLVPDAVPPSQTGSYLQEEPYQAKNDVLLNRPWVLYYATLIVWCYGYASEGPAPSVSPPATYQENMHQMRNYLITYGSISDPSGLADIKGFNNNTALLLVLRDTFADTRWELLHEASALLNNCITLNLGASIF